MLTVSGLYSTLQTGSEMARMVRTYHTDINHLNNLSLDAFFNLVKNLKYIPDPVGLEFVQRPAISLNPGAKFRDCDDKAVLMGAYLYNHRIPFRFVAVSFYPDKPVHHVLIQAVINNRMRIIDATYRKNRLFHFKKPAHFKPITEWIL